MSILTLRSSRRHLLRAAAAFALTGASWLCHAQPLEKLTLTTEWAPHGFHAPMYLALQKGWFKDAGLDLTIKDGRGSASTINLVGAGQSDVGFVNLSAAAIARAKGVPIKAVASILRKNTNGLIFKKGTGVTTPQQLRDKTIVYATTTIEAQLLDGYLATAGMTRNDVKLLGVDSASKVSSVVSGRGDAATGPVPYYRATLAGKTEIDALLYADQGIKMLDFGLVVHESAVTSRAKAIAALVKVMSKAYEYTAQGNNVDEAVKAMIALRPEANLDHTLAVAMFKEHAAFMASPATAGKPVGFLAPEDVRDTVKTLRDIKVIEGPLNPDDVYTTAFNP